jgi:glycine oxidase
MSTNADVAILGGGVIGLTTAYFLARERARVVVLDKGDFGQEASWAGAGIVPPVPMAESHSAFDRLRAHSASMFPQLSDELRELTGIDNGFLRSGGLELLGSQAGPREEWHVEGLALQSLTEAELIGLEPNLAPGLGPALYLPDMAQLRNPRHLKALVAAGRSRGVRYQAGCPGLGFLKTKRRIEAVRTSAGTISADRFLLASGAWTDPLMEGLIGKGPGIRPIRGQIALLHTGFPMIRRILLWGSRYLVPRPDGRILAGSTEEDAGFDKSTTAEAIASLLSLAQTLVPALRSAHLERCWSGLRPGSPDGLPFLGPIPGFDNIFIAAGHHRAGILTSPATALVMKECLLGQPLTVPLEAFRVDRRIDAR